MKGTVARYARSTPPSSQPTLYYVALPSQLLADLRDTPLAIGLYALVSRLYLIHHHPVPLSTPDVQRYDEALSRGAAIRAFERLARGGWLIRAEQTGHKTRYSPTWGLIRGAPRPCQADKPMLGKPRHIQSLRLERRLLDTCMGRLIPHDQHPAQIERYTSVPLLALGDIGAYALTLAGIPCETAGLRALGLVAQGQARQLPDDQALLAQVSQHSMDQPMEITSKGYRKLGLSQIATDQPDDHARPLFFVPPALIGMVIGTMIGNDHEQSAQSTAFERPETTLLHNPERSAGNQANQSDQIHPPSGGGNNALNHAKISADMHINGELATESALLLRQIHVAPQTVRELASQPVELVRSIIEDAQRRPGVRNLPAWVVSLVRTARDHGMAALRLGGHESPGAAGPQQLDALIARAKSSGLFISDDSPTPASTSQAAPALALEEQLRDALRRRSRPDLWPSIAALSISRRGQLLELRCGDRAQLARLQTDLLPLLRAILSGMGLSLKISLRIGA